MRTDFDVPSRHEFLDKAILTSLLSPVHGTVGTRNHFLRGLEKSRKRYNAAQDNWIDSHHRAASELVIPALWELRAGQQVFRSKLRWQKAE